MSNTNLIKPIAMAGFCVLGDKFILGEPDMTKSLWFGAAGAAGVYTAQLLAPLVPLEQYLPDGSFTDSRTLELRILEMSTAAGIGFAVNKFVLQNDPFVNIQINKLFVLAGSDFLAEYMDDYMSGRPLSFFKNI